MTADIRRIKKDIEFLTTIEPPRNYLNTASLDQAADFIKKQFERAGILVETQTWQAGNERYKNIIASYNNTHSKRLVVGAHYDVCGPQPGADDNASGIAGLLELAHLLNHYKPVINYRIDLVAYNLEEPPFFGSELMGSYIHAASLKKADVDLIGMICLEMIGYFTDEPESQLFPSSDLADKYPHTGNFIIVVGNEKYSHFNHTVYELMTHETKIDVQIINLPEANELAGLSDQRNYWKFGYPALMINDTSFLRNPHYHEKTDTIETLNLDKMTEVINCTYRAITGIR